MAHTSFGVFLFVFFPKKPMAGKLLITLYILTHWSQQSVVSFPFHGGLGYREIEESAQGHVLVSGRAQIWTQDI